MIILRTPKGWTGPKVVDGIPVEGTFRSHQVPLSGVRENPEHREMLEAWLRSYEPETLFDERADCCRNSLPWPHRAIGGWGPTLTPTVASLASISACPISASSRWRSQNLERCATSQHGRSVSCCGTSSSATRRHGTSASSAPDELTSNRLGATLEVENRCFQEPIISIDDHLAADGRVMEVLSEHNCEGWLEGYTLTGRHGLFATYEAFAMVQASMTVQHTKWLQEARELPWRAPVPSLNILLTSTCWRNDHNGFSHQGPGLIDVMLSKRGTVARIYLPPDANTLLSVADHCLQQPQLRQPHRGRQADAPAVPRPWTRPSSTAVAARPSGTGPAIPETDRATWCWRRPEMCPPWRSWPLRTGYASMRQS